MNDYKSATDHSYDFLDSEKYSCIMRDEVISSTIEIVDHNNLIEKLKMSIEYSKTSYDYDQVLSFLDEVELYFDDIEEATVYDFEEDDSYFINVEFSNLQDYIDKNGDVIGYLFGLENMKDYRNTDAFIDYLHSYFSMDCKEGL